MYGHEVVFQVNLQALGVARQNNLSAVHYNNLMLDIIDDVKKN
jgi:hypothetical protein